MAQYHIVLMNPSEPAYEADLEAPDQTLADTFARGLIAWYNDYYFGLPPADHADITAVDVVSQYAVYPAEANA